MKPLPSAIARHALAIYFALAFAISWGGVLLVIGGPGAVPGTKAETDRLFPLAYVAMLAGPSLAGILMTWMTRWRVGLPTCALALVAAPVVTTVVLLTLSLGSRDFLPAIFSVPDPWPLLGFGLVVALGAGTFEEIGWTGFATPALRARHGVIGGGLFLGMMWGAWHILVNLWASGADDGRISTTFMLPVLLSTVGLGMLPAYRVLMTQVHDRTGSLLVAMLMHASLTGSLILLRPAANGVALVVYEVVWAGVMWAVIAAIRVRSQSSAAASGRTSRSSKRIRNPERPGAVVSRP
jgi:membrane protease YdiL (CAAX protease family)